MGVQEVTPAMAAVLDDRLPAFARFGAGRDADGGGEQSAVLYRRDRFALEDGGTFWLSPTPGVPGSVGWDAALPRIATWARLRDRASSRTLVVVNTHFDHVGAVARRESAALVARRAPQIAGGAPLVVMGDLNATPDGDVYRALAAVLEDARLASEVAARGRRGDVERVRAGRGRPAHRLRVRPRRPRPGDRDARPNHRRRAGDGEPAAALGPPRRDGDRRLLAVPGLPHRPGRPSPRAGRSGPAGLEVV